MMWENCAYLRYIKFRKGVNKIVVCLEMTQFTKVAHDSTRLACDIIYLWDAKEKAGDWRVELMTYVNLLVSVVSILLAGMMAVIKNAVLPKEVEAKMGTEADFDGAEERHGNDNGSGMETLTIEYKANYRHDTHTQTQSSGGTLTRKSREGG